MTHPPSTPADPSSTPGKPLEKALAQNAQVKEKVVAVAEDLLVINTVLKQEIPEPMQTGEVAQALEKHEELENQVQECASELESVNQTLADEVDERKKLERALADTQAALASEQAARK